MCYVAVLIPDTQHTHNTNTHFCVTYLEDEWRFGDKYDTGEQKGHDQRPEKATRLPQKHERHDHDKHRGAENDGSGVT